MNVYTLIFHEGLTNLADRVIARFHP